MKAKIKQHTDEHGTHFTVPGAKQVGICSHTREVFMFDREAPPESSPRGYDYQKGGIPDEYVGFVPGDGVEVADLPEKLRAAMSLTPPEAEVTVSKATLEKLIAAGVEKAMAAAHAPR